jgi:hypothetical protein
MCGDTSCPSCGPLLGSNPAFEQACEWIYEVVLADMPSVIDRAWLAEDLADRLGKHEEIVVAIEATANAWARANRSKR